MLLDHPELTVENYTIPEYIRVSYLVTQAVDRSVEPVLDEFEAVQRRRQAFLSLVQYAAPAALAMRSINEISGTDLARQVRFEGEVRDYKRVIARQVEAGVLAGERLTVAEVAAVPTYSFRESDLGAVGRRVLFPIGYLFTAPSSCRCRPEHVTPTTRVGAEAISSPRSAGEESSASRRG